ncbi:hypothetical protein EHF33_01155 [Deinococcus psychrotolerans]|uniref:Cell wall-active antibiotics response LiaF-like C-terminal domain-containing protein n=1 Tax=Deinococcus psychrotolerans TaxID=2489213 RepID=A0A3G8Y9F0_9DEIO|nr:hypothetical protein [Deinococcus psychrotolerans]AZI41533.1 hypothetical protein EHF33_01155 [Deinococcus psychrotolerans]
MSHCHLRFPLVSLLAVFTLCTGSLAGLAETYNSLNLTLIQQKGNLSVSKEVDAPPISKAIARNKVGFATLNSTSPNWSLQLSPERPISLTVQHNQGNARLDLRSLKLKTLHVTQQDGILEIWLPKSSLVLTLDQQQVTTHLHLPKNVGVLVKIDQFSQGDLILFGKTIATGTDSDDRYQSHNYATAKEKVVVHLTMIQGHLEIEEQS